ncbi:MAG TPA: GNAT family N-acetyltransferase [Bacteroidetes bacterium]|nr:hypothetical protein BMS3Bbin03_01599 [bacterium BMS3Bbin03]HDK35401.1 GNAT family N-acetyltransferase [Bacteroidota bacterium]HDZ12010.1 GNAT family N-acetyltransferase [Bacteroidota bacterium]
MKIQVRVIRTWSEFLELRPEWETIFEELEEQNPFLSWDWIESWVEIYGHRYKPVILVVVDSPRVIGIAAFYFDEKARHGLTKTPAIRWVGDQFVSSEFLDILAPVYQKYTVWWNVLNWFLENRELNWNLLVLDDMIQSRFSVQIVEQISKKLSLGYHRAVKNVLPVLYFPPEWDKWKHSHPHPDFISMMRNRTKRLRKKFRVEIRKIGSQDELKSDIEIFFELHQKNWNYKGLPGSFVTPEKREFYRRITRRFLDRNWLEMRLMRIDGAPATVEVGFALNQVYYSLQSGYDPRFRRFSAGSILFYEFFQELLGDGIKRVEFLRGDETYKFRWGAHRRYSVTQWVGNRSLYGIAYPFYKRQKNRIKHAALAVFS